MVLAEKSGKRKVKTFDKFYFSSKFLYHEEIFLSYLQGGFRILILAAYRSALQLNIF